MYLAFRESSLDIRVYISGENRKGRLHWFSEAAFHVPEAPPDASADAPDPGPRSVDCESLHPVGGLDEHPTVHDHGREVRCVECKRLKGVAGVTGTPRRVE